MLHSDQDIVYSDQQIERYLKFNGETEFEF